VFALASGIDAGDVGGLVHGVHPHATHGVVHPRENLHGLDAGIDAAEFFVDFEDAFELAVEGFAVDGRDVEKDGGLAVEAELFLIDDAVNGTGGDVSRDEIAVFRVPLFKEIETFVFGNGFRGARVAGLFGNPDAAAFTAGGFAHQAEFVFTGDGRG